MGDDGRVYEGRGWTRVGAHTYGHNANSIAISFMGNFMTVTPSQNAINAALNLITRGKQLVRILKRNISPIQNLTKLPKLYLHEN